jgi:hypothetical protein
VADSRRTSAWVGIVLGGASLLIFGIGLPAIGLWLILTCITILVRANTGFVAIASDQ